MPIVPPREMTRRDGDGELNIDYEARPMMMVAVSCDGAMPDSVGPNR